MLASKFLAEPLKSLEGLKVLELGCGTGRNTELFVEKLGPRIDRFVATDISDGMLAIAKEKIRRMERGPGFESKLNYYFSC